MAEVKTKEQKVKIKLLMDCYIDGDIRQAGSEMMVDQSVATEFCDTKFTGYHPFYGYMPEMLYAEGNPLNREVRVRAVRVA